MTETGDSPTVQRPSGTSDFGMAAPVPAALQPNSQPRRRGRARMYDERTILAAAEEVFATYGFRGATTAMIAERAGVPKSNLHYYFSTKEALYLRVLEDILEAWLSAATAFDSAAEPRTALEDYIRAKMDYSRLRPHASKVWANEILNGAPHIRSHLETRLADWVADKSAAIERWVASGALPPVDPRHLLFLIWAATQHYADFEAQVRVLLGKDRLEPQDYRAAADFLTKIVLDGLRLPG